MAVVINGQDVSLPEDVHTINDLLGFYQLQEKMAVVEHNQTIMKKNNYEKSYIQDGDKIEIVHFVGGG
ncbi:sulfur carrier protein ThiS [Tuberibacillus sp. Marseille-P3662]|uniref:sulfur carrier protein ThiS n=1 Tax=Tuberibacillus sp. Marseille-P3662 TaxID=1965358 RepID=UPI000A1CF1E8|nr:sulfur carrier protein ThiS [Tuberibacillus sp. Marseille-P3662]